MEPHLAKNDKVLFYKYLDNATVYFEYGSGGSTYQASIRANIRKIYSVESDIEWQKRLVNTITSNTITYMFNEMDTRPNTWGNPGPNSTLTQHIQYSNQIKNLTREEQQTIDLVCIDGRFRVACCLKCFDSIGPDCVIAFDDFLDRKYYHVVLEYYTILEETSDNRMVILQKKQGVSCIPEELIKQYELDPR